MPGLCGESRKRWLSPAFVSFTLNRIDESTLKTDKIPCRKALGLQLAHFFITNLQLMI
jgi:hypothetical protein